MKDSPSLSQLFSLALVSRGLRRHMMSTLVTGRGSPLLILLPLLSDLEQEWEGAHGTTLQEHHPHGSTFIEVSC